MVWSAVTPRLVGDGRSAQTIFVVNSMIISRLESNRVFILILVAKGD